MSVKSKMRATLQRIRDPVLRERLLMVQVAQERPLREVAEEFGCTHGKVDFWKKRYQQHGLRGLSTKPRSGRPKKISRAQEQKVRRVVRKHNVKRGWRTLHVRQIIAEETGVKYCIRQTIRIIQSWGLSKIKPRPRYAFSKQEDRDAFLKKIRATWHVSQ